MKKTGSSVWPWFLRLRSLRRKVVDVDGLHRWMAAGETSLVIDVRTKNEYEGTEGRIPGAILLPLKRVRQEGPELIKGREGKIVFVCKRGIRSLAALGMLDYLGGDTFSLKGGMTAWNKRGFETIVDKPKAPGERTRKKEC